MIDIHCHVLWGIDDGPRSMEESLNSCKTLKNNGVNEIIATPHFIPGSNYVASPETVRKKVDELRKVIAQEVPGLNIYEGMELYITPELPELLKSKTVLSLNGSKYALVETSFSKIPSYIEDVFFRLQVEGYIPVFAHPERYCAILDMNRIEKFISKGVLLQLNLNSIVGKYGEAEKSFAIKLLTRGLAHFAATDSHRSPGRLSHVGGIERILTEHIDTESADILLNINPQRLLDNKEIEYIKPAPKKSLFSMFKEKFNL